MNLYDRLLEHDAWTTLQILNLCQNLSDEELDRQFEIGHHTIRATLHHIISNMEVWSQLMAGDAVIAASTEQSIECMVQRLHKAADLLDTVAHQVAATNAWDETWTDHLDNPPREKSYGTAIAHVVTHSMHHRAQLLFMLKRSGVRPLPEGDVFSWENSTQRSGT